MAAIFREDIELYPHREQASNTINGHVCPLLEMYGRFSSQ